MLYKFRRRARLPLILLLGVFCCTMAVLPALAGQGDVSGGGKNNPLSMESSSPADGQKNVALPVEIKCSFSKNVVNMTVSDNNKKCFALYSADGKKVPVEVVMADDQVDPENRRNIVLRPLQGLEPGTTYTVKVAPELQSKSGVNLGEEVVITFTTAGEGKATTAASLGEKAGTDQEKTPAPMNNTNSEKDSQEKTAAEPEAEDVTQPDAEKKSGPDWKRGQVLAAALLLLAGVAYMFYRIQKNK